MHLSLQTLYCFLAATYVAAVPTTMSNNLPRADPPISGSPPLSQRVPRSNNTPLRIMPLGNSITWGYLSTSGNGYRQPLLSLLSANHTKIQYIGSQRSGNMTNNQNEGHPGATISQIASYANLSLPQQPNLILMMAGTNDMAQDNQTATAPQRLGALIDECHNGVSKENGGTVILVAQLTPAADNGTESRIQAFNAQVPGVVDERAKKGMKVLTVDMSQYVTVGDLKDWLHPSDEGYAKMAKAWYDGIGEAIGRGWIEAPVLILGP